MLTAMAVWPSLARARQFAPVLLSSEPAAGSEHHQPPGEVSASFSEPLDASSEFHVLDECGNKLNGSTSVFGNEMSTDISRTPSGTYTVHYSAVGLGGVSGTTEGAFDFVVHGGKSCDGSGGGNHHGGGGNNNGGNGGGHNGHNNGGNGSGEHGGTSEHPSDHDVAMGGGHTEHDAAGSGDEHKPGHSAKSEHSNKGNQAGSNDSASPSVPTSRRIPIGREEVMLALTLTCALGLAGGLLLRNSAIA